MSPPPWANQAQITFLTNNLTKFTQAQNKKGLQLFWPQIHGDFFAIWPDAKSEVESTGKGERVKSVSDKDHVEWKELRIKNIYNWYNNHSLTKPNRAGKAEAVIITMPPTATRIPSELQIYSKTYYSTRIKPHVDAMLLNKSIQKSERIKIINKTIALQYENETENVKNEIKELRKKEEENKKQALQNDKDILEAKKELTPEQYMIGQAAIGRMALSFCEEMRDRSGWNCSFYASGPDGIIEGEISQISVHVGKDEFGRSFRLAHPRHEDEVMTPFTDFAKSVFKTGESRAKFIPKAEKGEIWPPIESLPKEPVGGPAAASQSSNPPFVNPAPLFPESTNTSGLSNDMELTLEDLFPNGFDPNFGEPFLSSESQRNLEHFNDDFQPLAPYSQLTTTFMQGLQQDLYMENNPAPMFDPSQVVFPPSTYASVVANMEPPISVGQRQQLEGSFLTAMQAISEPSITAASNTSTPAVTQNTQVDLPAQPVVLASEEPARLTDLRINARVPAQSTQPGVFPSEEPARPTDSSIDATVPAQSIQPPRPTINAMVPAVPADSYMPASPMDESNHMPAADAEQGTKSVIDPNTVVPSMAPPAVTIAQEQPCVRFAGVDEPSGPLCGVSDAGDSGCMVLSEPNIQVEALTNTSSTKAKPQGKGGHDDTSLILEGRRTRKSAGPRDVVTLVEKQQTNRSDPEWATTAKSYLSDGISFEPWIKCLEAWMQFERTSQSAITSHRMNAQSRPDALSRWVGNRKYHILPEIPDKSKFRAEWLIWWNSLQPEWRKTPVEAELPVPVSNAETDTLVGLYKRGPTGIVTVLIGLKWWWGGEDDESLWVRAVEDLTSCFEKMLRDGEMGGNSKRKANDPSARTAGTKKAKV